MRRIAALPRLLAVLLALVALPAPAHLLNMTRVQVDVAADGTVDMAMSIDLMREAGGPADYYRLSRVADPLHAPQLAPLRDRLQAALQLQVDAQPLALDLLALSLPQDSEAEFHNPTRWPMSTLRWRGRLPAGVDPAQARLTARFDPGFAFEEPIALTLQARADDRRMTRWLVAGQLSPRFALQAPAADAPDADADEARAGWAAVWQYLRFGFAHILPLGVDHLLFVVGLYLGTRHLRTLLLGVTSFTLAHSVTLILSSFGAVRVPAVIVEPAIALSIAWIAVENLLFREARCWRAAIVFAFGLLHGLGFAAALRELGLPPTHFVGALLSFNVGVEFGQLAVIALALLLTGAFRQRPWYRQRVVVPASLAIAAVALWWTWQRIAG